MFVWMKVAIIEYFTFKNDENRRQIGGFEKRSFNIELIKNTKTDQNEYVNGFTCFSVMLCFVRPKGTIERIENHVPTGYEL